MMSGKPCRPGIDWPTSRDPRHPPCGAGKGRVLGNRSTSNPTAAAGKVDVPLFGIKPQRAAQQAAGKVDLQQAPPKLKSAVKSVAPSAPKAAAQVQKQASKAADTVKAAAPKVCTRLQTNLLSGGDASESTRQSRRAITHLSMALQRLHAQVLACPRTKADFVMHA